MSKILPEETNQDKSECWSNDFDEHTIEIINKNALDSRPETDVLAASYEDLKPMNESSDNAENIYVEDIILMNPVDMAANKVIKYECSVAYFIQVLVEGSTQINRIKSSKNYNGETDLTVEKVLDIIHFLRWISHCCQVLAERIKQEAIVYQPETVPNIIRSSYNFCAKNTQCKNYYNKYEEPTCKEHHYVHSLLKHDVDSLISFLEYIVKNNKPLSDDDKNNIYLSIKTICYVTRHMAKEINYIDFITINNSELFHRNNPFEVNKRKIQNKRGSQTDEYIRHNRSTSDAGYSHKGRYLKNSDSKESNSAGCVFRSLGNECRTQNETMAYPRKPAHLSNRRGEYTNTKKYSSKKETNIDYLRNQNIYSILSEL